MTHSQFVVLLNPSYQSVKCKRTFMPKKEYTWINKFIISIWKFAIFNSRANVIFILSNTNASQRILYV